VQEYAGKVKGKWQRNYEMACLHNILSAYVAQENVIAHVS